MNENPVTAQEAVEAFNRLKALCDNTKCIDCIFNKPAPLNCLIAHHGAPCNWPDIKEAHDV